MLINCHLSRSLILAASILGAVQAFADADTPYHAELCDEAIGVTVTEFNCRDLSTSGGSGSVLTGQTTTSGKCDKPAKLNGQCVPQSLGGVLFDSPDAKVYLSCRTTNGGSTFNDVAVIAVNRNNGAACFYQSALGSPLTADEPRRPSLPQNEGGENSWFVDGGNCLTCHSNGALIRSPYMAATSNANHKIQGTGVNFFYTDNTPLWNVIRPEQEVYSISATNNTGTTEDETLCTSCHRLSAVWNGSSFSTSGTSSHYALAAHADNYDGTSTGQFTLTSAGFSNTYQPKNQSINQKKSLHSASSPLWMLPGSTSYSLSTFKSAAWMDFCTQRSTLSSAPAPCKPPVKQPRPSDLGIWGNGVALGRFGGETSSSISSVKNSADVVRNMFYPIMAGYFNNDAILDLAWREPVGSTGYKWVFYTGNNTGAFSLASFSYTWTAARPSNEIPFVGDFNGDGKTDIGIRINNQWIIKYNQGNGVFNGDTTFNAPSSIANDKLVVGDFNGDKKSDILNWNGNGAYIRKILSNGQFDSGTIVNGYNGSAQMAFAGDINGDGYADIAWSFMNTMWIYSNSYDRNRTPTNFGSFQHVGVGYASSDSTTTFFGDVNGDKLADFGELTFLSLSGSNSNKSVSVRYAIKGTEPRFIKSKSGECLTAVQPVATSGDLPGSNGLYSVRKDKPGLQTKACGSLTSWAEQTSRQLFKLGLHGEFLAKIESTVDSSLHRPFYLYADTASTVKQSDLRDIPTAGNKTDWNIVYTYGDMKYFQLKSASSGNCLQRNSSTSVVLTTCGSSDAQKWTHLL